jgi:hypothetical protein
MVNFEDGIAMPYKASAGEILGNVGRLCLKTFDDSSQLSRRQHFLYKYFEQFTLSIVGQLRPLLSIVCSRDLLGNPTVSHLVKEMFSPLWNPQICYHVHRRLPLHSVPNQQNSVQISTYSLLYFGSFSVILPSMRRSSKRSPAFT